MDTNEIVQKAISGETPLFEIFNLNSGHCYKIFANGMTEGFPEDCGVVNNACSVLSLMAGEIRRLRRQIYGIISSGHSFAVENVESTNAQDNPDLLALVKPLHEHEWHPVTQPPTNVREWQDAQPEKMLDRYKKAPIGLPD
jgi:hypothetical protein